VDVFEASDGKTCLSVQDDGVGMDRDRLLCMLSFGFSSKEYSDGNVGRFGIGFKSGSMRLAKDVLILTKRDGYAHAALLSQSFLDEIHADDILIPMFSWRIEVGADRKPRYVASAPANAAEWEEHMRVIERHAFVRTEKEVLGEISRIQGSHGTRIVLFNLRADELDYSSVKNDIRIAVMNDEGETVVGTAANDGKRRPGRGNAFQQARDAQQATLDVAEDYSLRSYMEILYLRPRCNFTLRGTGIKFRDPIANLERDYYKFPEYKPRGAHSGITLHMGYPAESSKLCGFHIYNKNRLIKMYQRFGSQLQANTMMKDMLGVVEADCLEPTHNKQAFKEADLAYMKFKKHLTQSMNDYYFGIQNVRNAGKGADHLRHRPKKRSKTGAKRKVNQKLAKKAKNREQLEDSESESSEYDNAPSIDLQRNLRNKRQARRATPLSRMKSIHYSMIVNKHSHPFRVPVDPVEFDIPDYFDVIKNPMDLGTISERLNKLDYYVDEDPDAYAADVRLVFANALTYNKEGDAVYKMAKAMSKFFENEWATRMKMDDFESSESDDEDDDALIDKSKMTRKAPRGAIANAPTSKANAPVAEPEHADPFVEQIMNMDVNQPVPQALQGIIDESFILSVQKSIQTLEDQLREERSRNAAFAATIAHSAPNGSNAAAATTQSEDHTTTLNTLLAANLELQQTIAKLEESNRSLESVRSQENSDAERSASTTLKTILAENLSLKEKIGALEELISAGELARVHFENKAKEATDLVKSLLQEKKTFVDEIERLVGVNNKLRAALPTRLSAPSAE